MWPLAGKTDRNITKAVEGFTPPGRDVGIEFLVGFGDGVEETPDVSCPKFTVGGFAPFAEDFGDLGGGDRSTVEGPDDEVVGFAVGDSLLLVGVDATIDSNKAVA